MHGLPKFLRTRTAAFTHDLLMIPAAWFGAYWLRFNLGEIPHDFWLRAFALFPLVVLAQGAAFWYFGLYRGIWRFASMPDLVQIVKAVATGLVIALAAVFLFTRLQGVPRSVFVLDGILLVALLGGPRFLYRWFKDRHLYVTATNCQRVLIIGAGRAGTALARELLDDPTSHYWPAAFVDDDIGKSRKNILGLPIASTCENIPAICRQFDIDLVLIAIPSATPLQLRRIVGICEKSELPFRTLPGMQDIVSGRVSVSDLRDVQIEDLLGREPVSPDWATIAQACDSRTVLVSGAGGSIGSELCRQLARLSCARLVALDRDEHSLCRLDAALRRDYPSLALISVLGDIGDRGLVDRTLGLHKPHTVFHAAAYKYVPLLEGQAYAAVRNNVFATRSLALAADRHGCESFILISTDKAVNPHNIMGMTKRITEIYCEALNYRSRTRYITVRFGNVMDSAGSVIPIFKKQIGRGGPVTVTHSDVTRYFMTIPEASQLILQAGAMGQGGEIFVLDMGEPVRIAYLAEQLVQLSGKRAQQDVKIVYTGLRPGEKLHEELFHDAEKMNHTAHPKILSAQHSHPADFEAVEKSLGALEAAYVAMGDTQIRQMLGQLIGQPAAEVPVAAATNVMVLPVKPSPHPNPSRVV